MSLHSTNLKHVDIEESSNEKKKRKKEMQVSKYRVASLLMGLLFCLMGLVFSTVEPIKTCSKCEDPLKIFIEIFYLYMYTASILWMCFMSRITYQKIRIKKINEVSFLTRLKKIFTKNKLKKEPHENQNSFVKSLKEIFHKKSENIFESEKNDNDDIFPKSILNSFLKPSNQEIKPIDFNDEQLEKTVDESNNNELLLTPAYASSEIISKETHEYQNFTGEIYMRVGLAIFTLCALISHTIHLVQMIEAYSNNKSNVFVCKATFATTVIAKISCVLFILVQSAFILKFANVVLHTGKTIIIMGLMHIMCTNFCLFVRTVIFETAAEIRHELEHDHEANYPYDKFSNHSIHNVHKRGIAKSDSTKIYYEQFNNLGCINVSITDTSKRIQQMQNYLAEFLYPIVIEYSLLAMTIFYVLWSNFKSRNTHNKTHKHSYEGLNQFAIDCTKSTTGLILGMTGLLLTVIFLTYNIITLCSMYSLLALISNFIYKNSNPLLAWYISEGTLLVLLVFSTMVVLRIYFKLKRPEFNYNSSFKLGYDEVLLIVGLGAIYLFELYSLIAVLNDGIEGSEYLLLTVLFMTIIESTLQSVLIIDSLKKSTDDKMLKRIKPGRSLITALILIDISLWLTETFSARKYDMNKIELGYYNIVFWSIVNSISSPLAIFFHFHAGVCLSEKWEELYE